MKAVFKGWYPQVGLVEEILLCWNWLITHILIRWVAFQTPQPFHPTRSALPKRVKNLSMLCYLQVTSYSAPCWLWTWLPLLPAAVSESFSGVVHLVGLISNKCKKKTLQHHTCRLSIFLINSQPPPPFQKMPTPTPITPFWVGRHPVELYWRLNQKSELPPKEATSTPNNFNFVERSASANLASAWRHGGCQEPGGKKRGLWLLCQVYFMLSNKMRGDQFFIQW